MAGHLAEHLAEHLARDDAGPGLRLALAMRPEWTGDLMGADQWRRLEAVAGVIDRRPLASFTEERAGGLLAKADILVTGWGCPPLDANVLAAAPRLRLVAHAGSSVKPIVSDALWARGVAVTSAAAANAIPVAEFALAAILLANKDAFRAREAYRGTRKPARRPWVAPGEPGNYQAVVGILGASRTGRHLLRLLRAFELRVLVHDPLVPAEDIAALGAQAVGLEALFEAADVVSIHAPSLPQTRRMVDQHLLARLRDGATLINTARGDLIDQEALERELVSGRIAAVLDVTEPEPLPAASALFGLPNVFLTPHLAGAAGHETRRLADLAIAEIERFAAGEPLHHAVTRDMLATIG